MDKLTAMRRAGIINRGAIQFGFANATPGMTTEALAKIINEYIRSAGAVPAFYGYMGFPGVCCMCIDEEVVHGVPGSRVIENGSILTIDCGVQLEGWNVDAAHTDIVGKPRSESELNYVKKGMELFNSYVQSIRAGMSLYDVAKLADDIFGPHGYKRYNNLNGHGIGERVHMSPTIFHTLVGLSKSIINHIKETKLQDGDTVCIEPILSKADHLTQILSSDNWTLFTADNSMPIHFENTICVHNTSLEIIS